MILMVHGTAHFMAGGAKTDRVPHPCGFQGAGFDFSARLPSRTKQTTYFLSDEFASVDGFSLNFRRIYPEFSRGYPLEFTRLIFSNSFIYHFCVSKQELVIGLARSFLSFPLKHAPKIMYDSICYLVLTAAFQKTPRFRGP